MPAKVAYSLTAFGEPLKPIILQMHRQFKNETHQPQELKKKGSSGTV